MRLHSAQKCSVTRSSCCRECGFETRELVTGWGLELSCTHCLALKGTSSKDPAPPYTDHVMLCCPDIFIGFSKRCLQHDWDVSKTIRQCSNTYLGHVCVCTANLYETTCRIGQAMLNTHPGHDIVCEQKLDMSDMFSIYVSCVFTKLQQTLRRMPGKFVEQQAHIHVYVVSGSPSIGAITNSHLP